MKKTIFLDVDGVLNRHGVEPDLQNELLARLARLVRESGADIVISSTWRKRTVLMERLMLAFVEHGIPTPIGTTPVCELLPSGYDRAFEILSWLADHPDRHEHWVAIDDESLWGVYPRNFRTRGNYGLTDDVVDAAVAFLARGRADVAIMQQAPNQRYHDGGDMDTLFFNGAAHSVVWPGNQQEPSP